MAESEEKMGFDLAQLSEQALSTFQPMLEQVPMASDNGAENIIMQIADAQSVDELDRAWEGQGWGDLLNRPVEVQAIRRAESDFDGGVGCYLIVDMTVLDSGERTTVTTGASSVVAQLVKAYCLGALPLRCVLVQSKKASRNGRYPQHLQILR